MSTDYPALPIRTFILLYGRKSKRHKWTLQCACGTVDRALFLRTCFLRDAAFSKWPEVETGIVSFNAESSGDYSRFPENVRVLPGVQVEEQGA